MYNSKRAKQDMLEALGETKRRQIKNIIQNSEFLSIQLDESSDITKREIITFVVNAFNSEGKTEVVFADGHEMSSNTGLAILEHFLTFCRDFEIDMKRIVAVATDGAPAMVGCYNGFTALVIKQFP